MPPKASSRPAFSEDRLYETAEVLKFGYKYANLRELQQLTYCFNEQNTGPKLGVPVFFGLTSFNIEYFFKHFGGFDIQAQWAAALSQLTSDDVQEMQQTRRFSETFWTHQKTFTDTLSSAMLQATCKAEAPDFLAQNLFGFSAETQKAVPEFLAAINHDALMVRSSGKEDSKRLANAGGNASIAYVAPHAEPLVDAICTVVLSYFSEKSLQQRLDAGDHSVFAPEITCPVILQQMIYSATNSNQPTRCGIMYTEEPSTGLFDQHAALAQMPTTSGISLIQSSWGNNAGIADGKVAVDTTLAVTGMDGVISLYPRYQHKPFRLEAESTKLSEISNDDAIALAPSLTVEQTIQLKRFADLLEQHYGCPQDVEFVVDNHKIYIVQTRPHLTQLPRRQPSYLTPEAIAATECTPIPCQKIIGFDGAVTLLQNATEYLVAETVEQAWDQYTKKDRAAIKLIIIGRPTPATSHFANMFAAGGKQLVQMDDLKTLHLAARQNHGLLYSPQQQLLIVSAPEQIPQINLYDMLAPGWTALPFAKQLSVLPATQALHWPSLASALDRPTTASLPELLKDLGSPIPETCRRAAQQLPAAMLKVIRFYLQGINLDTRMRAKIQALIQQAQCCCAQLSALAAPSTFSTPRSHNQRLVHLHFLDTLIHQQSSAPDALGFQSLIALCHILRQERQDKVPGFDRAPDEHKAIYLQLHKATNLAFDELTASTWPQFIQGLAAMDRQDPQANALPKLGRLVKTLADNTLFPMWLQTAFAHGLPAQPTPAQCGRFLAQQEQFVASNDEAFAHIKKINNIISSVDITQFAEQKHFERYWQCFDVMVLDCIRSPAFADLLKKMYDIPSDQKLNLVALATCHTVLRLVDVFDRGIKEMKCSQHIPAEKKPAYFKLMLSEFYGLLRIVWTKFRDPASELSLNNHCGISLPAYMYKYDIALEGDFIESDLEVPPGFSPSRFAIGSGYSIVDEMRELNGESLFIACHESLLNCICSMQFIAGGKNIRLPDELIGIRDMFQLSVEPPMRVVGHTITAHDLRIQLNAILNAHSLEVVLNHHRKSRTTHVQLHFFGGKDFEAYRWQSIACAVAAFSARYGCWSHVAIQHITEHELVISLKLHDLLSSQVLLLETFLKHAIAIATENRPGSKFLSFQDDSDRHDFSTPGFFEGMRDKLKTHQDGLVYLYRVFLGELSGHVDRLTTGRLTDHCSLRQKVNILCQLTEDLAFALTGQDHSKLQGSLHVTLPRLYVQVADDADLQQLLHTATYLLATQVNESFARYIPAEQSNTAKNSQANGHPNMPSYGRRSPTNTRR